MLAPSLLLCVGALVMVYAYLGTPVLEGNRGLTNLTESYGALERVALWQRALWWLPGARDGGRFFELPPGVIAWSARFAFAMMFVAQAWAFWLAWRGQVRSLWTWLVPPVVAHAIMIMLVPTNADVFFYEMTGDLAANGINPYEYPLMAFPDHPLLVYNHWIEMTAVYGPVWTAINSLIMRLTGPDPVLATVVYKVVLGLVALALAGLVYWFARKLTGNQALSVTAGMLVAWQPNLIVESTGQAHNDPLMLLLSTAGIFLAIAGGSQAIRGGLVLVTLSVLVKYVTLPLLGVLGLIRLVDRRRERGLGGVLGSWILDGIVILAVMVAAFAPFWAGFGTLTEMLMEPGRLYTNPIWFDPYILLQDIFPNRVAQVYMDLTRPALQLATFGLVLFAIVRFGKQMWEIGETRRPALGLPAWTRPVLVCWTIILTTLALLPVNSHPWYWTWPIVPIAILVTFDARANVTADGSIQAAVPRWFWGYLALTAIMTLAYHTRIVHL
jgi:hypothetical protein